MHAFLARLGDATVTLAAFSVAFAFNTTFSGIIGVEVPAAMSFITDRRSLWRVAFFYFAIAMAPFVLIEAVALTPLGDWVFGVLIGASPEATRLAKLASGVMGLWIFPNQVRNVATALCMMHRRTLPISYATILRLGGQALMLMVLPFWMEGAVAGAASLIGAMTVEAIYMCWACRAHYIELPAQGGEQAPRPAFSHAADGRDRGHRRDTAPGGDRRGQRDARRAESQRRSGRRRSRGRRVHDRGAAARPAPRLLQPRSRTAVSA